MALLWYCGFDYMATAQLALRGITAPVAIVTTGGRGGGNLLECYTDQIATLSGLPSSSTLIVGLAIKFASFGLPFLTFSNASGRQYAVGTTSGTLLYAARLDVSLIPQSPIQTGTTPLVAGVWYYIEVKVTIGDAGSVDVLLNSVSEISAAGIDTQYQATANADRIVLGYAKFDDLYICDDTGGALDDFLGDVTCEAILPNGNGTHSDLVGSDGNSVDNYALVDEVPPNSDTDYVKSATPGDIDTYAYPNISATSGTVYAVQPLLFARKDDAGARSICSVARLAGGTEEDGPDKSIGETYTYWPDIRTTKPGGGGWTISDVNGAEFGVKITA